MKGMKLFIYQTILRNQLKIGSNWNITAYYRRKNIKGALSSLRQFLATENPLQMMTNAIYFPLKAFFVLKLDI